MITKVARINHRVFKSFAWPAALPTLGRYNVIYGWNGSGKTTLSNLFRRMERKESLLATDGLAEITVGATTFPASDFSSAVGLPAVRVFNRDFVDASVFSTSSPIAPIFYFGAGSVEKQKAIEAARIDLQKKTDDSLRLKTKKEEAEAGLDRFCIEHATRIRELLSSSGKGSYNNYDKRSFKAACESLKGSDYKTKLLGDAQKTALRQKTTNQLQEPIPSVTETIHDLAVWRDEVAELLRRSVVSKVLAELVEDPETSDWVQVGLTLHTGERASPTCRFCSQNLSADRLAALTGHFNTEFQNFLDELVRKQTELHDLAEAIKAWRLPVKGDFYSHLRERATQPLTRLTAHRDTAAAYASLLVSALEAKRAKPFAALDLNDLVKDQPPDKGTATAVFSDLQTLVEEHNAECRSFSASVDTARKQLETAVVAEALPSYIANTSAQSTATTAYSESLTAVGSVNTTIATLEREISESVKPSVELTQELASYLGQSELKFEPKDKGYSITRSGVAATHLSEGEKTAIAFLYFLKSLQDKSFDLANSVVVIDDPISSLDTNAMFCAFGFMKTRTAAAGQLIILTHNFGFFRQVKNWFYHLPGQKKSDISQRPARFYFQQCVTIGGQRSASIGPLDPLLHQYESEYHYLFYRTHSEVGKTCANLADYYALPNMARRLLESFLSFRFPNEESLQAKLDRVTFDPAKKARILRFLHTYSHDDKVSDPGHDLSVLAETPQILADLMDLIKAEDQKHYDEMIKVLAEAAAQR